MAMHTVFGGCLESELSFPELRASTSPPNWNLRVALTEPELGGFEHIGEDVVDADIRVRSYRGPDAFALDYDDTGTFVVRNGGRDIDWWPRAGASEVSARLDVLGRVLPMALHAEGLLTLHGSAVAIDGRAIACLAPKYHGKSTLAYALVSAGASLITDDALAVDPGPPAVARPGVHCIRLFADSAARLGVDGNGRIAAGKLNLDALPDERRMPAPAPLDAIYLLAPTTDPQARAAERRPVDSILSAVSLVRHAKLGPLLGRSEASALFERAVCLARAVPVYELAIARDLARLDDAVATLLAWHRDGDAAS
jgi:hypothetical protein